MMYLLDANVLIDAKRDYYRFAAVPQFWEWLIIQGQSGSIKIPIEIYEELTKADDELSDWLKEGRVKGALLLDEEVNIPAIRNVVNNGYAPNLDDTEIERLGRDPFLIAYALCDIENRCVVTTEVSRPSRQRAKKHIPDVCDLLKIKCCHAFELYTKLDFNTRES